MGNTFFLLVIPILLFLLFLIIYQKTLKHNLEILDKIVIIVLIFYYYLFDIKYALLFCFVSLLYLNGNLNFLFNRYEAFGGTRIISTDTAFQEFQNYNASINAEELKQNAVIPLHIYQTWNTKSLPYRMKECVNKMKRDNPEFEHHLYDDNDCREFIQTNFDKDVLDSYDKLIPGAYKADLWRYCILYKKGGIYIDIKFKCENNFKLIQLVDKEYLVLERPYSANISISQEIELVNNPNYYNVVYNKIDSNFWKNKELGIYNAIMVCKPGNSVLLECIEQIVKNVKTKYYGYNPLYITGPGLLGEKYFKGDYYKISNFELFNCLHGNCILNKKGVIFSQYTEYRSDQQKSFNKNKKYYQDMWKERNVYDD